MEKIIYLFSDYPGTINRINRNNRFIFFCNEKKIKIFLPTLKKLIFLRFYLKKNQVCLLQNRPRRNLIYALFLPRKKTFIELRDPIIYKCNSSLDYILNFILLLLVRVKRIKCLSRPLIGMTKIEVNILNKNLIYTPEYGIDLSVISERESPKGVTKRIKLLYAGNFYSDFYKNMLMIPKSLDIQLDLYGGVDLSLELSDKICYCGTLTKASLFRKMQISDFNVSVFDNKDLNFLPSKSFELIALGQPIIHFSNSKDDRMSILIKKYNLGVVINNWLELEGGLKKFKLSRQSKRFSRLIRYFYSDEKYYESVIKVVFSDKN